MKRKLRPNTIAVMDRCQAAMWEHGPGTTSEIADWIGFVPCPCNGPCYHCRRAAVTGVAQGQRRARPDDVRAPLEYLVRSQGAMREKIGGSVIYIPIFARTLIPNEGLYERDDA